MTSRLATDPDGYEGRDRQARRGEARPQVNPLADMVDRNTQRDVIAEALQELEGDAAWDRELHDGNPDLKPMQIKGETRPFVGFTFHDAFAGMGGGSLGFTGAGGECMGAFEADGTARKYYEANLGHQALESLETVSASSWGAADVFLFGAPCQDFSVRGKRLGRTGRTGRLMWDQLRLVSEARGGYKVLCFEQVPHFAKINNGETFRQFRSEIDKLGYVLTSRTLFAPDYGSAQARRRL